MELYSGENYKLYHGNMLDMLEVIEPNSIDSIVTDPPYELGFMNKGWDNTGIAFQVDTWKKCYEVLKSGGYLLAFGGSRTYHRIACAIEDAGFEIRDTIMWLYGSGFPKSMNIGFAIDKKNGADVVLGDIKSGHEEFTNRKTDGHMKFDGGMDGFDRPWMHNAEKRESYHYEKVLQTPEAKRWQGWGTSLKPSFEPVIVARKPFKGSCVDNVLEYGVGGINIDECRIGNECITTNGARNNTMRGDERTGKALGMFKESKGLNTEHNGRFPANTILTYDETDFEEVCGGFPYTKSNGGHMTMQDFQDAGKKNSVNKIGFNDGETAKRKESSYIAPSDSGSAARYFYCAKASVRDRDEGLEELESKRLAYSNQAQAEVKRGNTLKTGGMNNVIIRKNIHPTVKPTSLMQYLVRLVTPKGGTILDPFNGSGSTGKAVMYENKDRDANYKYIGIELTEEYIPIARARIEYAIGVQEETEKIEEPEYKTLFDYFDIDPEG